MSGRAAQPTAPARSGSPRQSGKSSSLWSEHLFGRGRPYGWEVKAEGGRDRAELELGELPFRCRRLVELGRVGQVELVEPEGGRDGQEVQHHRRAKPDPSNAPGQL